MTSLDSQPTGLVAGAHRPVTHRQLDGWHVQCVDAAEGAPAGVTGLVLPATVPGQVHTDLRAAGLVPDPDLEGGEAAQDWVGLSRWHYWCEVEADAGAEGSRTDLVLEGVDTFAEVRLNGELVGRTRDQHLAYRFEVTDLLRPGANRVEVTFDSALAVALEREAAGGELPGPYQDPYSQVRKMACNFGWDWGPRLVTAGLWKPVRLETWGAARLGGVRPLVSVTGHGTEAPAAQVDVRVDVVLADAAGSYAVSAAVELLDPAGVVVASGQADVGSVAEGLDGVAGGSAAITLRVPDPQLWWPVGLGEQPLYTVRAVLLVDAAPVETAERRIGLRRVEVDRSADEKGERFALVVNGRRVRVRGYNWIPDLPFPNEVTRQRTERRLDQAVAGGANLLRVWGGGHVASADFLDGCDERGLMVWHDFLFACAAYSEDEDNVADVRREAEQAVSALSAHPSLVLWCGANECVWGWYDWDWQDTLAGRPWGARLWTEVLPDVVARLDPTRPYLPNSPWSWSLDVHPQDDAAGPVHIWTVWNQQDWPHYRDWDPAFVSEMGWCAPPTRTTLRRAVPSGELLPDNPGVVHHMRAEDGMTKIVRGVDEHFGTPACGDDWLYWSQLVQARAVAAGAQWLRSRERCAGVVVWQLNDCWPALSWAAVDVDGLEKPLWFSLRRAFADRLLTLEPVHVGDGWGERGLQVVLVNDGLTDWAEHVTVRRLSLDGRELARQELTLTAAADGSARAELSGDVATPADPARELVVADAPGHRSTWFFRRERELDYPAAAYEASVRREGADVVVQVRARTLLRDLVVHPDRAAELLGCPPQEVHVDDMLLTLLPGESGQVRLTGLPADVPDAALAALAERPVLRVASDAR